MLKKFDKFYYSERDISWLSFNERVLQEAADTRVPMIERLKFLSIFSSNMDEFFRVRVASLRRMLKVKEKSLLPYQNHPLHVIEEIQKIVLQQQEKFSLVYNEIIKSLEDEHVFILNEKDLNETQLENVREFFRNEILAYLFPIIMDDKFELPDMSDKNLYQIISMKIAESKDKVLYAILELPVDVLGRFYVIPSNDNNIYIILIDDIIRCCCDILFSIFDYDEFHSYTIKLTRDAELDLESELNSNLLEKLIESLKKRKKGTPTRLVYDERIPKEMLNFLIRKLKLSSRGLIPGGRYHNFKDFKDFPDVKNEKLKFSQVSPARILALESEKRMFDSISKGDIILHHPYQSFDYIIRLMREAALDPSVKSIQITLYRVAKKSNIVKALINAVRNGVEVIVYMELQARFDEEDNIYWAQKLDEAGATVYYGKTGQKIHCKMCLITRKEKGKLALYGHMATGNYNRITSKLYCDHGLLTKDKRLTEDMKKIFSNLHQPELLESPKYILLAPNNMKSKFISYIEQEIKNIKQGKQAYIICKMNSLVDGEIITKLYEASTAGVKIQLIIRGICCLVPGMAGQSENIKVISIIDRFLEHARVYIFANDGNEIIYLASADWMTRNLNNRIETAFPILNSECKKQIKKIMEIQLADNVKAREINIEQNNPYILASKIPHRAQLETQTYLNNHR